MSHRAFSNLSNQRPQTILAFDYGEKRIGIAVGNSLTQTAEPLKIIKNINVNERFKAIESLIKEWQASILVVGLPKYPDGAEHVMTQKARRFGNQLYGRFVLPVIWVDESYTSVSVNGGDDALAAQLLLQQYFSELPR